MLSPRHRRHHLATVVLTALALLPLAVSTAQGDDPPESVAITTGAGADWGIKQSFRTYIEGGIAGGTIEVSDGATRNPDGTFHFPLTSGSFDPATNATIVQLGGKVRMEGHDGALDMTVADPRIELTPAHARLLADVTSLPLAGGAPIVQTGVQFAALELDGVDPAIDADAGTTTWPAIPARLSPAAVGAFANHYSVGTTIDPIAFVYDGPGGKPLPPLESWSEPGVPAFGIVAQTTVTGVGVGALAPDPANGVVHAVGYSDADGGTAYRALDAATLDEQASLDDPAATWSSVGQIVQTQRVAFRAGTLFATTTGGPVRRTRLAADDYVQDPEIGTASPSAPTHVAAAPDASRLYVVGGGAAAPWARTLTEAAGNWLETDHTLDGSGGITTDLDVDADGTVLETHRLGTPSVRPVATLDFDVSPLARHEIEDATTADSAGYRRIAIAPGGVAYASESDTPPGRVLKLVNTGAGYAVDGEPLDTGYTIRQIAADPDDGTLYVGTKTGEDTHPVLVIREGEVVATIELPEVPEQLAVAGGTLYVANQSGSVWAIRQLGVTPQVTDEPDDVAIALDADETSREVVFAAAASGDPAPTVQWQSRPPGSAQFEDLVGETGTTLTVEAAVVDDGTAYRAVFANHSVGGTAPLVGEVASAPATLTVDAAPSVAVQPADVAAIEGASALLKVLPAGNPAPAVQWQRLDGGSWVDVPGAQDAFLAIPSATLAMDGAQYRARLDNALGTTYSQAATLTVSPALPASVSFGSGYLDWGVKTSFRSYIEGPIAHGSYAASDGATRNPDGTVRFELYGGTYQAAARTGELQLRGTLRFSGHDDGLGPQLDLTIRDPRLVLDGDTGTLFADVTSKAMVGGTVQQLPDVALVAVDLAGASPTPLIGGLALTALPSALTVAGAPAFAQYPAGTAMDPLSLTAGYGVPRPLPGPAPTPDPGPQPQPQPQPTDPGDPPAAKPPVITPKGGVRTLDHARRATLATLSCRKGPCVVAVPEHVRVRIGRKAFRATVLAPASLASGRRASIRIRLSKRSAEQLAGRRGHVTLRVAIVVGGKRTTRTLTVTVRGHRPAGA